MIDKPLVLKEAKTLLLLTIPIALSQLAQIGINVTDTIMAGRHSEVSLAGVAIGSSLWVPIFLLLMGIIMATTPMVAQAWGANNTRDIKHSVQQAMWLALVCGISTMILLQLLSNLFEFIEMENDVRAQAKNYVIAASFGLPALAIFQVLRSLNEGAHLTRPFLITSFLALLINIPLNYIFVYGKLGFPEMGGSGCGVATAIVLILECIVMLLMTLRNKKLSPIGWHLNWQRPNKQKIRELLHLGIPIGIAFLIESSMFTFIALFLAKLGSAVVASHQVAMSVISVLFMIPLSLSLALTIRCGYYIGKGQAQTARYIGLIGLTFTLATAALFSALILVASQEIATIYTSDLAVQALAVKLLFFAAIFQFSDALQVTAAGILRGYKDTRFAFYVVLVAYWGVGLPLGYILGLTSWWGSELGAIGFWLGLTVGLGLASILLVGRFFFVSAQHLNSSRD